MESLFSRGFSLFLCSCILLPFELTSVNVDVKYPPPNTYSYSYPLKNWVHIYLESAADLEGLYVQAISAPWGVPFGEFLANFDCNDCTEPKTSAFLEDDIHIVPCSKRAGLAFTHPNVFTVGGDPIDLEVQKKRNYFNTMHFNFRYTQYPCSEHTFAQFLIIAVRSFNGNLSRFETYFSPIYELDVTDNPSGAYYPFYHGWGTSQISCHTGPAADIKIWPGHNSTQKIRYSQVFDACLINDLQSQLEWYTCPPGPVQIVEADVPTQLTEWQDFRAKYNMTGDPKLETKYGTNAQFCSDSGTWEWTPGQATWPIPPDIEVVIEEGSVNLTTEIIGEKVTDTWTNPKNLSCQEIGGKKQCNETIETHVPDCNNFQINDCKASELAELNVLPLYGKDYFGTGEYVLNNSFCSGLNFTQQVDVVAIGWGNKYVLIMHGKLLIFGWTVGWNIIAFTARFMKEYTVIERRSSYFGIGKWLWYHIAWTYITFMALCTGVYLTAHQHKTFRPDLGNSSRAPSENLHDLCNVHILKEETQHCLSGERKIHNVIGTFSIFLFILSFATAWGRPTNRFIRFFLIWYHLLMAYLGKGLFYVILAIGYLSQEDFILWSTILAVVVTDGASLVMFGVATGLNFLVDRKFGIRGRSYFPVPEGIETHDIPILYQKVIGLMLPIHVVIQLVCYFVILGTFQNETGLCRPTL